MKSVTTKFKSGGIYEKHVVATWNVGNHLSICLEPSQHLLGTIPAFAWTHLSIFLEPSLHLLATISAFS